MLKIYYNDALAKLIKKSKLIVMKVLKSLKSAKTRDKNCRIVKRKGRTLVINKVNKRFKAKQA
jgi:large subunit ribosomal protein L36